MVNLDQVIPKISEVTDIILLPDQPPMYIVNNDLRVNYTKDNQLTKEITRSALAHRGRGRVYIGIGNFLI